MANPRWSESSVPRSLQERFAQLYYTLGLFCASYPTLIILLTASVVVICCSPLFSLPIPGNIPHYFVDTNITNENITRPRWMNNAPTLFVQQVLVKSMVSPWNDDLLLTDAFRGPLAESFKLLETIHNYQNRENSLSLDNLCLHVESLKQNAMKLSSVLPEYNCLILSPGNLWQQDFTRFQSDVNLVSTIYNYQSCTKGKSSICEMLLGIPVRDSGIKKYPLRAKQRVIQYALTIFLSEFKLSYIDGLRQHLKKLYPLMEFSELTETSLNNPMNIYYPENINYDELIPLSMAYFFMFLYIYFCVRKMEHVRSKVGVAFSAVLTVMSSLFMTIGICYFFGLEFTEESLGKKGLPYLMITVGLENILVLTKSVVSTASHLDSKIRIAQGLSKEGWNITKNLLLELTILTVGLLTFVPFIQELCVFAIVGLLCDFFLQIALYATMLSIDIRCIDSNLPYYPATSLYPKNVYYKSDVQNHRKSIPRSRSYPRFMGQDIVVASVRNQNITEHGGNVSKRLRMVNIWAKTRIVQRCFMMYMIVWIAKIVYDMNSIQNVVHFIRHDQIADVESFPSFDQDWRNNFSSLWENNHKTSISDMEAKIKKAEEEAEKNNKNGGEKNQNQTDYSRVTRMDYDTRKRLSLYHWSDILSIYNISVSGSYITVLPPIHIAQVISPERAKTLRNPDEKDIKFRWQSLAVAIDTLHPTGGDVGNLASAGVTEEGLEPLFPSSPMELFLVGLLCVTSAVVICYSFMVLYRCICGRDYAEWRASWSPIKTETVSNSNGNNNQQVVFEAVPIVMQKHSQQVECIATDGNVIVSTCLEGHINVWDAVTGELITHVKRKSCKIDTNHNKKLQEINDFENLPKNSLNRMNIYKSEDNHHQSPERYVQSKYGKEGNSSPIWAADCQDNIAVLACADGTLEFWECSSGLLLCIHKDEDKISITAVKIIGDTIVAAKLNGALCFYRMDIMTPSCQMKTVNPFNNISTKHRRGHLRCGSADSIKWQTDNEVEMQCIRLDYNRTHNQPITVLEVVGGRIITGSQDHTLKVLRFDDRCLLYTLHGHCGPITCLFVDRINASTSGSGSQDGLLCVWDLHTGACVYSIQAHDGSICSLTYSASYVISLGQDERLCIWDRFQGHLLNTISMAQAYCSSLSMLTHNLLITSKQGSLVVIDVRTSDEVRTVKLGHVNSCVLVKQILNIGDAVICDYGDQLRLIRFPLISDKSD